ncbi:MAG: hypothetical protein KGV50_02895 [Gammaproteobacteria bacterium]|nr:hypothetical protein [Gammaproteobacteria bacterium]
MLNNINNFRITLGLLKKRFLLAWRAEKRGKIGVGRATAAIFAALILSLAINIALSVFLPLEINNRLSLAMILTIPIWVGLAFYCLLMRNALVAWIKTIVLAVIIFALTLAIGV